MPVNSLPLSLTIIRVGSKRGMKVLGRLEIAAPSAEGEVARSDDEVAVLVGCECGDLGGERPRCWRKRSRIRGPRGALPARSVRIGFLQRRRGSAPPGCGPHKCIENDGIEERQAERVGGEDHLSPRLDSCDFGRLESRVSSPGTCRSGFIASIGLRRAYARKCAALPVSSYVLCGWLPRCKR